MAKTLAWISVRGQNSVKHPLSYHKPHLFINRYSKLVLKPSKLPDNSSFIEFLGSLTSTEFPASWEKDTYIIPTKFKGSGSDVQPRMQWTTPESISSSDTMTSTESPSTSSSEYAHNFKVKLPLNKPQVHNTPVKNANQLQKHKGEESENKATAAVHSSPTSGRNVLGKAWLDAASSPRDEKPVISISSVVPSCPLSAETEPNEDFWKTNFS